MVLEIRLGSQKILMVNLNEFTKFNVINNIVFGGAGFLGSHLIDKLLKEGQNVLCIDNLSSGKLGNITHLNKEKKFLFINHDILEPLSSTILIEKIWHLASPASPPVYQNDPIRTIRVNYEGTFNLLNLAKAHNSKILFASTSEVYGETKNYPQEEDMPVILSTFSPRACYSEGKRIAETLINSYREKYNLETKIARIFNTYGPRLNINDGRVISNFVRQCLKNDKLTIYGDGTQTRSFCYVSDLIEGLSSLMETNYYFPINIGSEEEISIIKLAELIKTKINKDIIFEYQKLPLDDPERRKPCLNKAKKYLNWSPQMTLVEGLNKTISYYKGI